MTARAASKELRVLHIVGDSRYGGVARIILGLGRIAHADGWQVDVLATDPAVQEALQRQSLGIVNLDVIRREIRPFWDLAGLLRLCRFLRRQRYEIVHTHTSKGGFIGRLAAWLAGVPVIVHTVHGFAFHEQSPALVRIAYSALERLAARWCHRIVSVSEFHQRWALELGICAPPHIQAIPNGITPALRSGHCEPAGLRRQLGVGEGELLILSPTRLAADKGLAYLIEAAAVLSRGELKYRLAIAGDGPVRARLESMAHATGVSDRVAFLGFREDIGDLLAASDLVILPSLREGLSISLLEAMAAGKPIIASNIGSHRELASQADMARLVPPANPAALAEAIQQVAHDPALMAHLASAAHSLFESRYTEDRMLNEYRQLYLSLVETRLPVRGAAPVPGETSRVRHAATGDLAGIVAIHQTAFKQFFLTRMGAPFLRRYYELVLNYRAGIVLVSESRGRLNGFVCGFVNPAEFYRLMWGKRQTFAPAALAALLRHPWLVTNVLYGVRRIQDSAAQGAPRSCELSSIAVIPEASGNGVGRKLLHAFLDQSWSKDAQCVYLTTDADANDAANALYREIGFHHSRRFLQRRGRWMNEYVFRRQANEPVEINR
jgi:glycosyltransferase involved in cell wall biosynthesis/ribosomal protein S18 acetylase RimI-like enzyme